MDSIMHPFAGFARSACPGSDGSTRSDRGARRRAYGAGAAFSTSRAITSFWISLVPSPISASLTSRR